MPLHHAVLALLADGPSHGYELKASFERSVGPQWGALNIGHLYQVLDRLERDNLAISTKVVQGTKPDRVVYEITDAGRAELADWLSSASPRTSGFRDDFFLKMMAAVHSGRLETLTTVLTNQRTLLLRELRNLATLRRAHSDDLVVSLLITAAERHIAADLSFLDDAEEALSAQTSWRAVKGRRRTVDTRPRRDERTA